jgi:ferric-dicitrate binding protein FerR (iron transport regulator)
MAEDRQAPERPIDPLLARFLKGEATPEEEYAVQQWRRASYQNELEYRELALLVRWSARIPELIEVPARPFAAELLRRRGRDVTPIARHRGARAGRWLAAAAGVAVFVGAYLYASRAAPPATSAFGVREIVTSASETSTLELRDGTVIRLAPSSRLRVVDDGGRREVVLEGHAFFAVAKQYGTPFAIRTQAGEITVLGTRLDVEARGRDMRLVVVEGHVALSTGNDRTELSAGEMSRVTDGLPTPVVRVPDIGALVQWAGDFLAFQSTPLRDAAREIERAYGVRVEIPDRALAQRVITAWFRDRSLSEVMDVVCLAVAARCTIEGGVVLMTPEAYGGAR